MKKCPRCGAQNDDDAMFCIECGAKLYQSTSGAWEQPVLDEPKQKKEIVYCPQCGVENSPDNKFCVMCGFPLHEEEEVKKCPVCGAVLQGNEAFCMTCGAPLRKVGMTPPAGIRPSAATSNGAKGQDADRKDKKIEMNKTIMGVPSPLAPTPSGGQGAPQPPSPPEVPANPAPASTTAPGHSQSRSSVKIAAAPNVSENAKTMYAPSGHISGSMQPTQAGGQSVENAKTMYAPSGHISGSHAPADPQNTVRMLHPPEDVTQTAPTVLVRYRNGKGEWHVSGTVVVGQGAVNVPWSGDSFLTERDASLTVLEEAIYVEPLAQINPMLVLHPSRTTLVDGQWIRMGNSLFVFRKGEPGMNSPHRLEGVRLTGSQEPEPWGWLRHIGPTGHVIGVYPLWGDNLVLGSGSMLPAVPSMAKHHARVVRQGNAVSIEPLDGEVWTSVVQPTRLALPVIIMIGGMEYEFGRDEDA